MKGAALMMELFLWFAVFVGLVTASPPRIIFDCTGADGVLWFACGAYGLCRGGQYSQIDCVNGTVYNQDAQQCTQRDSRVPPPCNRPIPDCTQFISPDFPVRRIADREPDQQRNRPACSFYFTCANGTFLGYQLCPPGTVYDEQDMRCDRPERVPPDCGSGPQRPSPAPIIFSITDRTGSGRSQGNSGTGYPYQPPSSGNPNNGGNPSNPYQPSNGGSPSYPYQPPSGGNPNYPYQPNGGTTKSPPYAVPNYGVNPWYYLRYRRY